MTRIAVWGLGPHAFKNILPAIGESNVLELAGVVSRSEEKVADAIARWGTKRWRTPEEMLSDASVDAVYVTTPTGLHFEHGMLVLGAGKHLICEKSLTASPTQSLALVAEARSRALVICEALMFQYHPRIEAIRSIIRDPAFGRSLHAFASFGLPPLAQPGFRGNADLGGGAFLDVACYTLCLARALFGHAPRVLHANIRSASGESVDTAGDAALLFDSGTRADVTWGYNRAYTAEMTIIGEGGSVYANRLFAKDTPLDSVIIRRDRSGAASALQVASASAFAGMFEVVSAATTDSAARERLYDSAEGQARLMRDVSVCAR
ncbi:MAG: Gfo/Idh/MocA family oxidoreductase [Gemmatimonadota bacterium]